MPILRTLRRMYYAAGRLLDFSGAYNYSLWAKRLETPGWFRDKQAFLHDGTMIAGDMQRATKRLESLHENKTH